MKRPPRGCAPAQNVATFRRLRRGIGALALALTSVSPAFSFIEFTTTGHSLGAAAGGIRSIAAADLDRDGRLDLVTGSYDGRVEAWRNDGSPFVGTWPATVIAVTTGQVFVAAADLDGDVDLDVVVGSSDGTIRILRNGGGPFAGPWSSQLVGTTSGLPVVRVADLDRDGRLDLASTGTVTGAFGEIAIWRNDGTPFDAEWESLVIFATWEPAGIDVADFDRLLGPDLVIGRDASYITVLQNLGAPFAGLWTYGDVGVGSYGPLTGLTVVDLDGDSYPDVAESRGLFDQAHFVYRNDHTPVDGAWSSGAFGTLEALTIVAADLDIDGDPDLVTGGARGPGAELVAWESPASPFGGGWNPVALGSASDGISAVAAVDLDGDLDIDLVTGAGPGEPDPLVAWSNLAVLPGDPDLEVTEPALAFGPVLLGDVATATLHVRNAAGGVLNVASITADRDDFQASPAAFQLSSRQSRLVTVSFAPAAAGTRDALLTIASNDSDEPAFVVTMSGEGIVPPGIAVSPESLDETVNAGNPITRTLAIQNTGGAPLAVAAPSPTSWVQVAPANLAVPPGGSRQLSVTLGTADLPAGEFNSVITLSTNSPSAPFVGIPVHLTVIGAPNIRIEPELITLTSALDYATSGATTEHDFPIELAPDEGGTLEVIADGDYGDPSEGASVIAEGESLGGLSSTGTDCTPTQQTFDLSSELLAELAADGTVSVTVVNTPDVGAFCGVNRHTLQLRYSVGSIPLDFGQVFLGASATRSLIVRNGGTDVLHVSSVSTDSGVFTASSLPSEMGPQEAAPVTVTFRPAAAGNVEGLLTIVSDDPDQPELRIPLRGWGATPPVIGVTPAQLTAHLYSGERTTRTLTVTNSGGSDLTFAAAVVLTEPLRVFRGESGAESPDETWRDPGHRSGEPWNGGGLATVIPPARTGAETLLVEDVYPWNTTSNETALEQAGIEFDIATSSQLFALDLNQYKLVIVAGDQTTLFYSTIAAQQSRIAGWVAAGGTLVFHGAGWGWNGGDASQVVLPGGAAMSSNPQTQNLVVAPGHPTVAGVDPVFSGSDASHADVLGFPPGTTVITEDSAGLATLVEYRHGAGRVLASGHPLEHGYAYGNQNLRRVLVNLVGYANAIIPRWVEVSPAAGTVPPGGSVELTVSFDAADLNGGLYEAPIVVTSNDPSRPEVIVPTSLEVTGAPDVEVVGVVTTATSSRKFYTIGASTIHALDAPQTPQGDGILTVTAHGDFGTSGESAAVEVEGLSLGSVGPAGSDCTETARSFRISAGDFATVAADGVVNVEIRNSSLVDPICAVNDHELRLEYVNPVFPLDFGSQYLGRKVRRWITIENRGTERLNLLGVTLTNPAFSVFTSPASVAVGARGTIGVAFLTTSPGAQAASLRILSDDPDEPAVEVSLAASGVVPPDIRVSPTSLEEHLLAGQTAVRTVTVANDGGIGLPYRAALLDSFEAGPEPLPAARALELAQRGAAPPTPSAESVGTGRNAATRDPRPALAGTYSGSHLVFGLSDYGEIMPFQSPPGTEHLAVGTWSSGYTLAYRVNGVDQVAFADYQQRSNLAAIRFQEIVNTPDGVVVEVETRTLDGAVGIVRRFSFERSARYVQVTTTLTNRGAQTLTDVVLKSHADWDMDWDYDGDTWDYDRSRNMIHAHELTHAALAGVEPPDLMDIDGWDDIGVRSTTVDVPSGPILLDGNAVLHYDLGALSSGSMRSIGVVVAAGADAAELAQAVDLGRRTATIHVSPSSGTVAPHGFETIEVSFDASHALGGDYVKRLVLSSNDPDEPEVVIPVRLVVHGIPDLVLETSHLDFGTIFIGHPRFLPVTVQNVGTDVLHVATLQSSRPEFHADVPGVTVAIGASRTFFVWFDSTTVGTVQADLLVKSDDPNDSERVIGLLGSAILAPEIAIRPAVFSESVTSGDVVALPFTIENRGGSELVAFLMTESERNPAATPAGAAAGFDDVTVVNRPARGRGRGSLQRSGPVDAPPEKPLRTLVVRGAEDDVDALVADLATLSFLVTPAVWNEGAGTPALSDLAAYDAVVVAMESAPRAAASLGDVLADYVDAGGGLVLTVGSLASGAAIGGRLATDGYLPLLPGFVYSGFASLGARDPGHPILTNVAHLDAPLFGDLAAAAGTEVVARWSHGTPLAATKGDRVVAVSFLAHGAFAATGDAVRLMGNSIAWTARGAWLFTAAKRVVVPARSKVMTDVWMDATGRREGDYFGTIRVFSNDPATPVVAAAVDLHVTGVPDAEVVSEMSTTESVRDYSVSGAVTSHAVAVSPDLLGGISVELLADGDYGDSSETASLFGEDGQPLGTVGPTGSDCTLAQGSLTIGAAAAAEMAADGVIEFTVRNTPAVDVFCEVNRHTVRVHYRTSLSPLEFGGIFVGATRHLTAALRNAGTGSLHVTSVVSDSPSFSATVDSTTVAPDGTTTIRVAFMPAVTGIQTATIAITSDDPDEPVVMLQVRGEGLIPPDIAVQPAAISESLVTGQQVIRTLTIENSGGSPLEFSIDLRFGPGEFAPRWALLVQDVAPWGTSANQAVLSANGIPFDLVDSAGLGSTDLSAFSHILIASDQPTGFYQRVTAQLSRLSAWVSAGGTLQAHTAGWGWNSGDASLLRLPGGLRIVASSSLQNYVVAPAHPAVQGVAAVFPGNSASHGYLAEYPATATVICTDTSGLPTLVEYALGTGHVIASSQTLEFSLLNGFPDVGRILTNLVPYAHGLSPEWLHLSAVSGIVAPGAVRELEALLDATDLVGGAYDAAIIITSNDPDEPRVEVPVHADVVGAPDIEVAGPVVVVASSRSYATDGAVTTHAFAVPTPPEEGGTFTLVAEGDYGSSIETATLVVEGDALGSAGGTVTDCLVAQASFAVDQAALAAYAADQVIEVVVQNSFDVNTFCAANQHTVQLTYSLSLDPLNFGAVHVGDTAAVDVTVANAGTDTLQIVAVESDSPDFIAPSGAASVAPGESIVLSVAFHPSAPVELAGHLTIRSNDPDEPERVIALAGVGFAP